jgi:hypothetical protein
MLAPCSYLRAGARAMREPSLTISPGSGTNWGCWRSSDNGGNRIRNDGRDLFLALFPAQPRFTPGAIAARPRTEPAAETDLNVARRFQTGDLMSRLFNDAGVLSEFAREIQRRGVGETFVRRPTNWARPLKEQLHGLTTIEGFGAERMENQRCGAHDITYRRNVMRGEFWPPRHAVHGLAHRCRRPVGGGMVREQPGGGRPHKLPGRLDGVLPVRGADCVKPLRRLSKIHSMSQRAFACSARDPTVLALDEAISALDSEHRTHHFRQTSTRL